MTLFCINQIQRTRKSKKIELQRVETLKFRNLTSDKTLLKEEDIFTLSEGQIFGEERFCEIVAQKDQESQNDRLDERKSSIEI